MTLSVVYPAVLQTAINLGISQGGGVHTFPDMNDLELHPCPGHHTLQLTRTGCRQQQQQLLVVVRRKTGPVPLTPRQRSKIATHDRYPALKACAECTAPISPWSGETDR